MEFRNLTIQESLKHDLLKFTRMHEPSPNCLRKLIARFQLQSVRSKTRAIITSG